MSQSLPAAVWVDTDMGVDDMHALLYLRHAGVTPVAQSLVFGCARLPQVSINAAGFDALFQWGRPWHLGAEQTHRGITRTADHVLGLSGLPTRGMSLPSAPALPATDSAVTALINWLSGNPSQPEILALGPLSNIASLYRQAPELAHRIHRITWMGGATARGNQTPYAEFNAWADAEAAATVFASGIPVCMVDLEVCRQVQLLPDDLLPLSLIRTLQGRLLHDLLAGYLDIGLSRGRSGMAIYDPVAAAALVRPEDFQRQRVSIQVSATPNEHEGQTQLQAHTDIDSVHEILTLQNPDTIKAQLLDALLVAADTHDR